MPDVITLYLDDSGTRYPDHKPGRTAAHGRDWFALGGILIRECDEIRVRDAHTRFCASWNFSAPLHSQEIRGRTENFTWLAALSGPELGRFMRELGALVTLPELTAIACVIDRPGYNDRYAQQYAGQRWLLCKTAFSVVVERAAKFALGQSCRLRVFVEESDKKTDRVVRGYYDEMRKIGLPFDPRTSAKYAPLPQSQLHETLYDFKTKRKTSPMIQLADVALWPMCIGGYDANNRAYRAMVDAGTLIDSRLAADLVSTDGIKYSCMPPPPDSRNTKAQSG
jgi:hypothetical protein